MARKGNQLKGKEWYSLEAPEMFGGGKIGEMAASTQEDLKGRKIQVGATSMRRSSNKYYFKLNFKVDEVEKGGAKCRFVGHDCARDYITRMVRKRSKRIDERTEVETKDGVEIIVKTVCATIKSVGSSTQTGIRKKISEVLKNEVSDMSLKEFVDAILSGKLQKGLKEEVDRIYPLRDIELRKSEILE